MTLGQSYHALKGLALGKYHTKFDSYKLQEKCGRKIAPKLAGKLEPGYECDIRTYAPMHIRT